MPSDSKSQVFSFLNRIFENKLEHTHNAPHPYRSNFSYAGEQIKWYFYFRTSIQNLQRELDSLCSFHSYFGCKLSKKRIILLIMENGETLETSHFLPNKDVLIISSEAIDYLENKVQLLDEPKLILQIRALLKRNNGMLRKKELETSAAVGLLYSENYQDLHMTKKARIFLSYALEDTDEVKKVYSKLKGLGYEPWMDDMDLLPGQEWEVTIKEAISDSKFIILFLSRKSVAKEGPFQKEVREALENRKEKLEGRLFLIPVRLDDCEIPANLKKIHYVDLFDESGFDKLKKSLAPLNE